MRKTCPVHLWCDDFLVMTGATLMTKKSVMRFQSSLFLLSDDCDEVVHERGRNGDEYIPVIYDIVT